MKERIKLNDLNKEALAGMYAIEGYLAGCGLEASLLHLIKFRVSQINGCAYCLDMHSKDLRAAGESEQRLYLLSAWRESPSYTERERAALAWAESVTLVADTHIPDEVYEEARKQFTATELANLTLAVGAINTWNRLSIAFRVTPGTYKPAHAHTTSATPVTQ
jgi:AhpD family alkylhydroperoxidase